MVNEMKSCTLWFSAVFCALLIGCQGTPTIPQRASEEAQTPIQLPERIEIPPPSIIPEQAPVVEVPRPRIGGDEVVSFEMRGVPLANAIHLVAERAQANVYLDAELDSLVDASFPSVRLDDALDVLLVQNGLRLVEEPAGVYWVRADDGTQRETATFRIQSIDVASIEEDLQALVSAETVIVVNPEQNFIIVDGTAKDVSLIAQYIEGVDRLKKQVLLEVEIVELMLDSGFQLGLSHVINGADIGGSSGLVSLAQNLVTGQGEFSLTFENANIPLETTLTALQQYVGVNVVASPRVLAVTKSAANVEVLTEVPYIQATVSTDVGNGNAGSATTEEVEFKEVGVTLNVTPTVQEAGVVEIQIEQSLSNVIEFFNGIPVVDERKFSTVMLVQDGHTVVIGGLQQNSIIEDDSGVPILMDIPFLGRLFRSDSDTGQKRQLLVFITPRIVDCGQAAQLSHNLRQNYSETVRTSGVSSVEDK